MKSAETPNPCTTLPAPSAGEPPPPHLTTSAPSPTAQTFNQPTLWTQNLMDFLLVRQQLGYTLGISQTALSPSVPQNIYPIPLSNWPHIAFRTLFLINPQLPSANVQVHIQILRKAENPTLKVLSPLFKDELFYFYEHIHFPKRPHRNNLKITGSILNF